MLMGKGCVGWVTAGWCVRDAAGLVGVLGGGPHSHTEPGLGSGGAWEGFVLLWALGLEGASLWEQRARGTCLGWVIVKVIIQGCM